MAHLRWRMLLENHIHRYLRPLERDQYGMGPFCLRECEITNLAIAVRAKTTLIKKKGRTSEEFRTPRMTGRKSLPESGASAW